jgi:hypothetical protein
MKRFWSARQRQRFVSVHAPIANLFTVPCNDIPSAHHRELRATAMQAWRQIALNVHNLLVLISAFCYHYKNADL